jgi:tetratricopeptide (TPR) repeat protein
MDDRRGTLSFALALVACLVTSGVHGQPPAVERPDSASLERIDVSIQGWRLDEAEAALERGGLGPSNAVELRRARLDLKRARHDALIARLGARLAAKKGLSPELRVLLGRSLDARGRRDEARVVLDVLADQYESGSLTSPKDKLWLALSLVANDYPADANDIFREVLDAPGAPPQARVQWAKLFRARYNHRDASQLLEESLKASPGDVDTRVELAAVDVESDRDYARAIDRLKKVIESAPQCIPAHNLLARIDLENERPQAAVKRLLSTSLKVAPKNLEALALLATAHALLDDAPAFAKIEQRALAIHPRAAAFYTTVSEHLSRMHRYGEAAALDERAIALDPRHWKAYTSLGIGRGRLGDDAGAKRLLERAHEGDPYEVRTYNLLERFYDKPIQSFEWVDARPMRLRVHQRERAVLELVLPALVQEAYAHLVKAYGVKAELPLHLEIFPDREMFSVRSTGLPKLSAHGICFGHLITARSPSAGNFNWAEVLWHELSHVFHIQLSKSRVPRWFTEGLAIFEATEGRPEWRREMDERLVSYRDAGRLRGISEFNLSFTRARSMEDILVAYYHAYLVSAFIVERHGREVMPRMLRAWGAKLQTSRVFVDVLGVSDLKAFDEAFDQWLGQRLAKHYRTVRLSPRLAASELAARMKVAKGAPEDARVLTRAAEAQLGSGELEEALALSRRALEASEGHPHALLIRGLARYRLGDLAGARADLTRLLSEGHDGLGIRRTLASIASRLGDERAEVAHLEAGLAIDPQQVPMYMALIARLDALKEASRAYAWRQRAAQVDQGNPSLVAQLLEGAKTHDASSEQVLKWGEMGLHIAPFDADLQTRFAQELIRFGDKKRAAEVLAVALAASPKHADARSLAETLGL